MTAHEIRKKYLSFFASKGHVILPSSSLVPENDPTTLFTGSGMQPMVPYLLGEPHPQGKRFVDSQKCFRAQDIDEVGDNRHTTFFEMLGNWSLGDYFKKEQIPWMFEFLSIDLGLDPARIYVTVFRGNEKLGIPRDEESAEIWQKCFRARVIDAKTVDFSEKLGMQGGRIFYYGEEKNWWSRAGIPEKMPEGEPGGPDSEMFWDFGIGLRLHEESAWKDAPCHVNCDCGRFMEIGNNVFMEYQKKGGSFALLPQKNVDFGGGLERMTAAIIDNPDIFAIDVFSEPREILEKLTKKKYNDDEKTMRAFRIILDHIRAATFILGDDFGVMPSNKDQGYVVRRLIRRAIVQGTKLGITEFFSSKLARAVIGSYQDVYNELARSSDKIIAEFDDEERKFHETLQVGLKKLDTLIAKGEKAISGVDVFDLYATYGFPPELTREVIAEKTYGTIQIDEEDFDKRFKEHQELSRAGSTQKFAGGLADHSAEVIRGHTATHLLHQALRVALGEHVAQKGSNITRERLRFDFSHAQKLSAEEIKKVEDIVNEQIKKELPVHFEILDVAEAKRCGAIGLFEDTYAQLGGKIKVYFVGDETHGYFSREICGGPHVANTKELKSFKIIKEEAVSAGIRRIKAVVGQEEENIA